MENARVEPESSEEDVESLFEDENGWNNVINLDQVDIENDENITEHAEIENIETTASNAENAEMATILDDVESDDTNIFPTLFHPENDLLESIEIYKNGNAISSTENLIQELDDVNDQTIVDKPEVNASATNVENSEEPNDVEMQHEIVENKSICFNANDKQLRSNSTTTENVSSTFEITKPQQLESKNEAKNAEANDQTNSCDLKSELLVKSKTEIVKMTYCQRRRFNYALHIGFPREQAIQIAMFGKEKSDKLKKPTKNTKPTKLVKKNIPNQAIKKEMVSQNKESNNKRSLCNEQKDPAIKRIKLSSPSTSSANSSASETNPHNEESQVKSEAITPVDKGASSLNTLPSKPTHLNLVQGDFPHSAQYTNQKVLTFLGAQNNLKTNMWNVVKRRSGATLLTLHIQVDDNTWTKLTKLGGLVSYRFGELKLNMKNINNDGPASSGVSTSKHLPKSENDNPGNEPQRMQHQSMAALSH